MKNDKLSSATAVVADCGTDHTKIKYSTQATHSPSDHFLLHVYVHPLSL